jgi:ribonuclease G
MRVSSKPSRRSGGNLLTELYVERHRHRSIVGSVYKGVVTNVLPGMQAAFVDIGSAKDAFLYAGDYTANLGDVAERCWPLCEDGTEPTSTDRDARRGPEGRVEEPTAPRAGRRSRSSAARTDVLVQVSKESLGTKGARITSFISLPGAYLVYMPQAATSASRAASATTASATGCAPRSLRLPPGGFILRTNAEGKSESGVRRRRRVPHAALGAGAGPLRAGVGARRPARGG